MATFYCQGATCQGPHEVASIGTRAVEAPKTQNAKKKADAWALVAFLDDERPAAAQVEVSLSSGDAAACSINLGEVLYTQIRTVGAVAARDGVTKLRGEMTIVDPDWDLVVAAARVKAGGGLSYADAFCVATAGRLEAEMWTGDPEIIEMAEQLPCEVRDLRTPLRGRYSGSGMAERLLEERKRESD